MSRPRFSNGTEYTIWEERNCHACVHDTCDAQGVPQCPIQLALFVEAHVADGDADGYAQCLTHIVPMVMKPHGTFADDCRLRYVKP